MIYGLKFSGWLAWVMWRTIYLSKLPRLEKKLRVALDWTLDLLFSRDLCQFLDVRREHKMSNDPLAQLRDTAANIGMKPEQAAQASVAV